MSFILDALKKADAERSASTHQHRSHAVAAENKSGSIRDMNDRSTTGATLRRRLLPVMLLVLCLIGLFAGANWYQKQNAMSNAPNVSLSSEHVVVPTSPMQSFQTRKFDTLPPSEVPVAESVITPSPVKKPPKRTVAEASVSPPTLASKAIPALNQLPAGLRQEIPAFVINGSIYSQNPKDRMLLIDKRMLHEGDEIAAGLRLEAINEKSVIMRYKGISFAVNN